MLLDSHGEQPQSPASRMITLPVPVVALGHAPLLYMALTAFSFFFLIFIYLFIYTRSLLQQVGSFFLVLLFVYLFGCAGCWLGHVGSDSLTRHQTQVLSIGSVTS